MASFDPYLRTYPIKIDESEIQRVTLEQSSKKENDIFDIKKTAAIELNSIKEKAIAEVRVSKSSDISDCVVYKGINTDVETEEQLVSRVTVSGLEENTCYYYQWNTGDGGSFRSADLPRHNQRTREALR